MTGKKLYLDYYVTVPHCLLNIHVLLNKFPKLYTINIDNVGEYCLKIIVKVHLKV